MADNTRLNANTTTGDLIATDDIGGTKHQRVKVQYGKDGSATDASSENPFPVEFHQRDHDAFGRHRVSNPFDVFEVQHEYNTNPLIWNDTLTGSGTVTHLPLESSVRLRVGTASGDKVVRESKRHFRYKPGKSQLVFMTGILGAGKSNVRQRLGYFNVNDGIYFEQTLANTSVVIRSSTSGSVVDTPVLQTNWNIDKLDGTGTSGITLDPSKANIFVMDLQWLGVGRVRFGFSFGGDIVYCHEVSHANLLTTVYMKTANLPLCYEIENIGTSASNTDLKQICATIASEGGVEISGFPFSVGNGDTQISVTTRIAIMSIRAKSTFNSITNTGLIIPQSFEVFTEQKPVFYELIHGATLGGTPVWNSVNTNSLVEFDVAGTTITGGHVIETGYLPTAGKNKGGLADTLLTKLPLTNSDALTIVATSLNTSTDTYGSITWREIY